MKLPRSSTRRYRVLQAFLGRSMSQEEVIAKFGIFGFDWPSEMRTELKCLAQLGYLLGTPDRYELNSAVEQQMQVQGVEKVDLVQPRVYNVFAAPTLPPSYYQNPLRRKTIFDAQPRRRHIASDPIPFNEEEA